MRELHDSLDRSDPHLPGFGKHREHGAHRCLRHAEPCAELGGRHLAVSLPEAAEDVLIELAPEIGLAWNAHAWAPRWLGYATMLGHRGLDASGYVNPEGRGEASEA